MARRKPSPLPVASLNQFLLLSVECTGTSMLRLDIPPIAYVLTSGMIHGQTNFLPLGFAHAFVKLHRQGVRFGFVRNHSPQELVQLCRR